MAKDRLNPCIYYVCKGETCKKYRPRKSGQKQESVKRVVDLQKRYQRQGHSIDFADFLLDDESEVLRRCDEAERYLLTVTARRSYEDRI